MHKDMKILGLHKDPWHNSGASVIVEENGVVKFGNLSEERVNREKDSRKFPELSTKVLMKEFGIRDVNDFDYVVMDYIVNKEDWKKDYFRKQCSQDNYLNEIEQDKINIINHHLCHAYNAFYSSKFKDAAILVVDGRGSAGETQSLYYGNVNEGITLIDKTKKIGIGLLYAAVTQAIGFKLLQEGKTMGLAPFGNDGSAPIMDFKGIFNGIETSYEDICVEGSYKLNIEHPPIESFEKKAKVAFEVQEECEKAMLHLAKYAKEKTGCNNLVISGGVALNSVANYKILQSGIFEDIFINPAASDTGISLGAALYGYHALGKNPKLYKDISPYLGPSYSDKEINMAIEKNNGYKVISNGAFEEAAKLINSGKILGLFQGRSEMGPRALGNRSIIMNPLKAEYKDILNERVKFRESFRPFAPAILFELKEEYFKIDRESPYMLLVPEVKPGKEKIIPAVTHVDNTGRLQTVTEEFNPKFYKLIEAFYKESGVPVLLNTSFNIADEPIVESPGDAINCFMKTNIDALLIENYLLIKNL